ncbi:MAG: type II secretion system F family protein [Lachnospiraceae bacterium]|nr:type II secretion system F family protein [Lachnospiraceae bacterium]MBP5702540.1 type II secretion system F family protein [Lachnospiraceae bacterium]MBP5763162.1 type II secretion system F family protein [Lachnospiraceae bacterium]
MNVCFSASVFTLLLAGFYGLMEGFRTTENIKKTAGVLSRRLDEKGRENALRKREAIRMRADRDGIWPRIDRALVYSGIVRLLPGLTTEKFIALMSVACALIFISSGIAAGVIAGGIITAVFLFSVYAFIKLLEIRNLRKTGEDLPRLLDLLGSYAASGAVYSNIFGQISIYMNEPLRTVFDECGAEGRLSGDISLALLTMADKIEHPQFKQLIRNMEITSRYSEDIAGLVSDTRRSLRDYLKESSDRKAMLRESAINMVLLMVMSYVVIAISASLAETQVSTVVLGSIPGRVTLGVLGAVLMMFFAQAASLYK